MSEKDLIRKCCSQIEENLKWGPSDRWTNQDFDRLSELVLQKTKIKLSVSTLKRVWGKVIYTNLPAADTLNAIAIFNGYESWRQFWQHNLLKADIGETNLAIEELPIRKLWWQKPEIRKAVFMVTLLLLGLIIFLFFS